MSQNSKQGLQLKNPMLEPFNILTGEWKTVGHHRLMPGTTFHGHTSFNWLEGGTFIVMHTQMDEPEVPDSASVIGSDDAAGRLYMLYYDVRGISRKFEVRFNGNVLEMWRDFPGFSQRCKCVVKDGGNSMEGIWELCEDGVNWVRDMELIYTKVG